MAPRSLLSFVAAGGLAACAFPDYLLEQDPASLLARICSDGLVSGAETGVDCGGGCPPCAEEQPCKAPSDCLTGACPDGLCRPASCEDGVQNGAESDRDCGGQCDRTCDVGDDCGTAAECASRVCGEGSCQVPACNDGVRNGDETGVDCGGSCSSCGIAAGCAVDADCVSGECAQLLCVAPQCTDGSVNGNETGVDCGGTQCGPCAPGEECRLAADCTSSTCDARFHCAESRCDDQILNGGETDVDCGGPVCGGCIELQACQAGSDCASAVCQSERCVPAAPTGNLIAREGWIGSASVTFPGDAPSDVFDDDLGSIWSTGAVQEPGMFFQIDLGTVRAFYSVELDCPVAGDEPGSLDIYLWQSGEPVAPARTQIVGFPETSIEFATPQVARYIRLVLAQSKSTWWCISELYVRQ